MQCTVVDVDHLYLPVNYNALTLVFCDM